MSSNKKPPGHIHKIREFELEKIHLADHFDILQIVGEGWFGKILLVEHRATDTEMVLKALPKPYVSLRDFYREFHYGLHLGLHKNIVTTYDVAFETAGFYVFTQEYAPFGDLTSNMSQSGIGELHSKRVAKQIALALDYIHSKDIVHRDVKLDNILIYRSDFSRVKLCDFGESFRIGTVVERRNEWLPYSPPEVLEVKPEDTYKADASHDIWQFGIIIFVCLTGCLPWQKAANDDPRYSRYLAWHSTNSMLPLRRTPKLFKLLSSKAAKMFKRFLEPKLERRPKGLSDVWKFLDDRWLAKGAEKDLAENEQDELCPSMYSYHSCPEEKNKLLSTLAKHGIETTVNRNLKKARIRDWIESSIITEEDEEEDSGTGTPSSSVSREPVAGHISYVKAKENIKRINTTLKDASNKHFDPRTGIIQHGPSLMGAIYSNNTNNITDSMMNIDNTTINKSSSSSSIINGKNRNFNSGSLITLESRNDIIVADIQSSSYHSESNINMQNTTDQMVNSLPNIPSSFNNNNLQKFKINNNNNNNVNDNSQNDFRNYILNNNSNNNNSTVKTNDNTNNINTNNNNNNNKNDNYNNSFINSNKFDKKYLSTLSFNNNNINSITLDGLINSQSITTISVSEVNQQYQQQQRQQHKSQQQQQQQQQHQQWQYEKNQIKQTITNSNSNNIKLNDNNHEENLDYSIREFQKNKSFKNDNHIKTMSSLSLMHIDDNYNDQYNSMILNKNSMSNTSIYQHQTMKDTPYDYIKKSKNKEKDMKSVIN